jgi:hypothetical protein
MQTVLVVGWTTFGSTLRRLKPHLPRHCLSVSPMPTVVFPRLEELDITLSKFEFLSDRVVNNHHTTLQSLKLSFDKVLAKDGLDACCCFLQIRHLPHLRTLHFNYCIFDEEYLDTSGLHSFLVTHSTSLRELRLDLYCPRDGWSPTNDQYAQPVFRVTLPCLESLELGSGCCDNVGITAVYLQQYTRSLTRLKLERTHLSFQEVEVLLDVLTEHSKLQSLTIDVQHFSPQLLDLLAIKLPSLDHLHMVFHYLRPTQHLLRTTYDDDIQLVSAYFTSIRSAYRVVVLSGTAFAFIS